MEQHESREKYVDEDASIERALNCMKSSMHTSKCPPITNSDLESHNSSAKFLNTMILSIKTEKPLLWRKIKIHVQSEQNSKVFVVFFFITEEPSMAKLLKPALGKSRYHQWRFEHETIYLLLGPHLPAFTLTNWATLVGYLWYITHQEKTNIQQTKTEICFH